MKKVCNNCGKLIKMNEVCNCKKPQVVKPKVSNKKDEIHTTRWKKKRLQILKRDGYLCMRCFIKYKIINEEDLTVHHILSRKNHIEKMYDDDNLITLCSTCNKQLGTRDKLDFEWNKDRYKEREYFL